jgi:hypothetical protein
LGNHFAEFVQEDVLGLVDTVGLSFDEVGNSYAGVSSLGQVQQLTTVFEVDFP